MTQPTTDILEGRLKRAEKKYSDGLKEFDAVLNNAGATHTDCLRQLQKLKLMLEKLVVAYEPVITRGNRDGWQIGVSAITMEQRHSGTTPELWYPADGILLINFRKLEIPQITPSMSACSFKSIKSKLHKSKGCCLILVSTFLLKIILIFCNWNSFTFSRRICHNSGIVRGSWHGCAAPSKFPPLFFFYRRHPSLLSLRTSV